MHFRQKLAFMALGSILTIAGYLLATLTSDVTAQPATQTETIIFEGFPTQRVIVNVMDEEGNVIPCKSQEVGKQESKEYKCVIVKIEDRYYWKSRNNKALKRSDIELGFAFYRSNGDHITIPDPKWKKWYKNGGNGKYVEHINEGMSSIIYIGNITTNVQENP